MAEMVIDPVCKMEVDPDTAAAKSDYNGTAYYFCAVGCKLAFDEEPSKYLNGGVAAAAAGTAPHAPAAEAAAGASKPPWWQFWRT
ncbi:MAG: YHS domain-containing protein [Dehalococcoidia bacterium]